MNWLDIAILVILALSAIYGLTVGLIGAVVGFLGVIVGVVLAGRFYSSVAGALGFVPEAAAKVLAFILILAATMAVAWLVAKTLKTFTSLVLLGWLNHLGGAVLGLLWGATTAGALLTLWLKFIGTAGVIQDSRLAAIMLSYFPLVLAPLPHEFDAVRSFFK
ncbi:MAG: CvpA family protein [Chloroflexota bacterium]